MANVKRKARRKRNPAILDSSEPEAEHSTLQDAPVKKTRLSATMPWDLEFTEPSPEKAPTKIVTNSLPTSMLDRIYSHQVIPLERLVIHKKKLAELEQWFAHFQDRHVRRDGSILLLSGLSGSGKTTSVRSFCSRYGIETVDGYEFNATNRKHGQENCTLRKTAFPALKLVSEDDPCLPRDSPSSGLRLVLFDDLPNVECNSLLEEIVFGDETTQLQMALIVTDPCGHHSLLDHPILRKIRNMKRATRIDFNPIAPSLIKMLLKDCDVDSANDLGKDGDARAALLRTVFSKIPMAHDSGPYASAYCDSSFDVFHTAGKILYPRNGKETIDPSALTESNRCMIHALLAHNYPKFFASTRSMFSIADAFSWLESVDWSVRRDHLWEGNYSSTPEVLISFLSQRAPHPALKFQPIESPRYGEARPSLYQRRLLEEDEQD